jgi:hypothetical protein
MEPRRATRSTSPAGVRRRRPTICQPLSRSHQPARRSAWRPRFSAC